MKNIGEVIIRNLLVIAFSLGTTLAGAADGSVNTVKLALSGSQEVPPVTTSASGNGSIVVRADKTITGSITTSGINGTAGHIHEGAVGANGAVIVTLTKTSENVWSVPTAAKLSDAQYDNFVAGKLYLNIHSAAHKDGEIRAQLKP